MTRQTNALQKTVHVFGSKGRPTTTYIKVLEYHCGRILHLIPGFLVRVGMISNGHIDFLCVHIRVGIRAKAKRTGKSRKLRIGPCILHLQMG